MSAGIRRGDVDLHSAPPIFGDARSPLYRDGRPRGAVRPNGVGADDSSLGWVGPRFGEAEILIGGARGRAQPVHRTRGGAHGQIHQNAGYGQRRGRKVVEARRITRLHRPQEIFRHHSQQRLKDIAEGGPRLRAGRVPQSGDQRSGTPPSISRHPAQGGPARPAEGLWGSRCSWRIINEPNGAGGHASTRATPHRTIRGKGNHGV